MESKKEHYKECGTEDHAAHLLDPMERIICRFKYLLVWNVPFRCDSTGAPNALTYEQRAD